jgi:hypothetical protein
MVETDKAIVTCPTCRHPTERHLGWFKTVPVKSTANSSRNSRY